MLTKVKELPRYLADCERFRLGVACHSGDLRAEGRRLFEQLQDAVEMFDNSVMGLGFKGSHLDHVSAQKQLADAKQDMEQWMLRHAPNVHVDETKYQ